MTIEVLEALRMIKKYIQEFETVSVWWQAEWDESTQTITYNKLTARSPEIELTLEEEPYLSVWVSDDNFSSSFLSTVQEVESNYRDSQLNSLFALHDLLDKPLGFESIFQNEVKRLKSLEYFDSPKVPSLL